MNTLVREYYELVRRYCSLVEGLVITRENTEELMSILLQLYEKSLHLPNLDVKGVNVECFKGLLKLTIEVPDSYWEVYNPFAEDEDGLVCGTICDDINDIYNDLMQGVAEYEAGEINDAVFHWKEGASGHWGNHAVSLIRALHWLRLEH